MPFRPVTYFLAGLVLTCLAFAAVGGILVMRSGSAKVRAALGLPFLPSHELEMPEDIQAELQSIGAIIENIPVLAVRKSPHDTILVQPAPEVEWALRPNVKLDVMVMPSAGDIDLDPPLLHVPAGAQLSERARNYIRDRARLTMTYTTTADGHRLTVPAVQAERKLLVIGDSVAFGVGVDDRDTMASYLQRALGENIEVVNAGVGGYDGQQAAMTAGMLSGQNTYAALVYIACQNDFMLDTSEDWIEEVRRVTTKLKAVASRFERVIVVLETHLEYDSRDVLLDQGWPVEWLTKTEALRRRMPDEMKAAGFTYVDWGAMVEEYRRRMGSVFAPFALHVDHVHLSPEGNRLMAERVAALLVP